MTYEDQLGSIVARMKDLTLTLKTIEEFQETMNAHAATLAYKLEQANEQLSRLQADIILFRSQTARPE